MSDNCTVAPANGRITGTQIRIVAVVVLGAFLALLNQTVMSPALPVIMSDFAIDASTAQWIMSIYPLPKARRPTGEITCTCYACIRYDRKKAAAQSALGEQQERPRIPGAAELRCMLWSNPS